MGFAYWILVKVHMIDNCAIICNFQNPITFEMGLDIDCYPYLPSYFLSIVHIYLLIFRFAV